MLRTLAYATLFSTALLGSHAYAADDAAAPKDNLPQAQAPSGVDFVTKQEKRSGVRQSWSESAFTAPTTSKSEEIDDLVMDHNGATQTVVIGVGGFLGFGKKEVAVPFAALQWRTEGRRVPAMDQPPANPVASTTGQAVSNRR